MCTIPYICKSTAKHSWKETTNNLKNPAQSKKHINASPLQNDTPPTLKPQSLTSSAADEVTEGDLACLA